MKRLFGIAAALMMSAGGAYYALGTTNADCPLKGTPDCPLVQNCALKGTPDCPLAANTAKVPECCKK